MALRKPLFLLKRSIGWNLRGSPFGSNRRIWRRPWSGGGTGPIPGPVGPAIIFNAPLTNSLIPSAAVDGTNTFVRTSDATVTGFEGLVKTVESGEARFPGARRVQNLVNNSVDFTSDWIPFGTGSVVDNGDGTATLGWLGGTANRVRLQSTQVDGQVVFNRLFILSFEARAKSGEEGEISRIRMRAAAGTQNAVFTSYNLGADWQRFSIVAWGGADATSTGIWVEFTGNNVAPTSTGCDLRSIQMEEVSGQSVQIAGDYVSIGNSEDHGANQDGVKDFNTENDNSSVNASTRVLTEVTGSPIAAATLAGVFVEEQRPNYADTDDDLTGGAETIDITAGGTGDYTVSVSGNANVTIAAGTAVSPDLPLVVTAGNPATFNIPVTTGTITLTLNAGLLDTDIFGNYLKQVEKGSLATSFIPSPTTTVATRNAEALSYPNTNILDDEGTLAFTFTPDGDSADYIGGGDRALVGVRGVDNDLIHIDTTTGKLILSDGTNESVPTTLPALVAGTATKVAIRWSATAGTMEIRQDAVEVSATFDGSLNKSTPIRFGYAGAARANGSHKDVLIYNGPVDDTTFTGLTS